MIDPERAHADRRPTDREPSGGRPNNEAEARLNECLPSLGSFAHRRKGGKSGEGRIALPTRSPSPCLFARLQVGPIEKALLPRAHRMPPFDLNSHFGEEGAARELRVSLHLADIARRMQLNRQIPCE